MTADVSFLRDLCLAPGPSGYEEPAQEVFRRRLAALAEPVTDVLGNVTVTVGGGGTPRVVVEAHVDQIGLQVTWVDDKGFVYFDKVGSIDNGLLPGRAVVIHDVRGAVMGVVGKRPTHLMDTDERGRAPAVHEQWIDIGAVSRADAESRVTPGDPVVFAPHFVDFGNGIMASRAMDDRAGVFTVARTLELYAGRAGAAQLTALSSVQEETRFMGAIVQRRALDVDCIIVVDGDFATDQPEVDARKAGGAVKLGGGPVLGHGGASNRRLMALCVEVAAAEGIPVQNKAYPGDTQTDAEVLQAAGHGVAGLNIGLPMRYMHSPHEVAHVDDLEMTARLLSALTRRLGEVYEPGYFTPRV